MNNSLIFPMKYTIIIYGDNNEIAVINHNELQRFANPISCCSEGETKEKVKM